MIKKIIVLAISFVLMLGSAIYTGVSTDAVSYGSGAGASRTITSVAELTSLISNLPNVSVYDENANVTDAEGYSDFKGVTIIENGEYSKYSNYKVNVTMGDTSDIPEEDIEYYVSREHTYKNQRLEMFFALDCIYYHSVGTEWTATEYYRSSKNPTEFYASLDNLKIAKCDATDYDVEVYYSKDKVLFKINKYERYYQEAESAEYSSTNYPKYKVTEKPTDEDYEPSELEIYGQLVVKAFSDNYGVWVELDREATGVDGMEPDYDAVENMTQEQQQEYMLNLMVTGLLSEYSYKQLNSIIETNAKNFNYLTRFASFVNETISKPGYYDIEGSKYLFNSYMTIPGYRCNWCGQFYENQVSECGKCDNENSHIVPGEFGTSEPSYEYIRAMTGWPAQQSSNGPSYYSKLQFTFGQNTRIEQEVSQTSNSNYISSRYDEKIVSNSTILNVDNTIVKVLKKSKAKTLEEAFGKSLRKSLSALLSQQGGNE